MNREVRVTVDYRWWSEGEIVASHVLLLDEHAEEHIAEMRLKGYTSGDLHASFEDDCGEEVEYAGWWSINTEVIKSEHR